MAYFFGKHNGDYILTHHPFKGAKEMTNEEVNHLREMRGKEWMALMRDKENNPVWIDTRYSYRFMKNKVDNQIASKMAAARYWEGLSDNPDVWKAYRTKLAAVAYQDDYPFSVKYPEVPEGKGN